MLTSPRQRRAAGATALGLVLALALWAPIPHLGDEAAAKVAAATRERLPGWTVTNAVDTWEGGYAVVASCGSSRLGFQVIPGHGLPAHDLWLQPNDAFTASRLSDLSDYPSYLIWRASPLVSRSLSCREELARIASGSSATQRATTLASDRNAAENAAEGVEAGRRPVE